jgi:hypothetical protein
MLNYSLSVLILVLLLTLGNIGIIYYLDGAFLHGNNGPNNDGKMVSLDLSVAPKRASMCTLQWLISMHVNALQVGKFTLRQIDSAIYRFDEDLKEYEDHVQAGREEAWKGER